jgi:hypothetical protein
MQVLRDAAGGGAAGPNTLKRRCSREAAMDRWLSAMVIWPQSSAKLSLKQGSRMARLCRPDIDVGRSTLGKAMTRRRYVDRRLLGRVFHMPKLIQWQSLWRSLGLTSPELRHADNGGH